MGKRLTQGEFVAKAREMHGDKYDYSQTVYVSAHEKVLIRCKRHDWVFPQSANSHMRGCGCPRCRTDDNRVRDTYSTKQAVAKLRAVHGDSLSFDKVIYKTAHCKVEVFCSKHGYFWATYANLSMGRGCPGCRGKRIATTKTRSTSEFKERASAVHGNRYDYSKVHYLSAKLPVLITCREHGDFEQLPDKHINAKHGCPTCGEVRGNGYKLGLWVRAASNALTFSGYRCYLLKLSGNGETFYKVGVTYRPLLTRLQSIPYEAEVLAEHVSHEFPEVIWRAEKSLLRDCRRWSYTPMKCFGGDTECFIPPASVDVLDWWDRVPGTSTC